MAIENKNVSPSAFAAQLSPNGRFSLEANKVFTTYTQASTYVSTNPTVYLGKTITVYNDTEDKNGVYWVSYADTSKESLTLTKLGTSSLGDISIKKEATAENGFSATYKLITTIDGTETQLGASINIPRDLVVSSGSIVDNPQGQPAGTYLKLELAGGTNPVYIDVAKLIENPYTGDGTYITVENGGITLDIDAVKGSVLPTGSAETPHIIWSNNDWVAGKVDINTIVPTANKVANSVLAYNGNEVVWTTVEVQPELPAYSASNNGNILQVNSEGALIWTSAPNNTTITNTEEENVVVSSTISNGSEEVEVYSKEGVNKLLSWTTL